ncbi:alpha/beta fold hydrolase (plasmid) [Legionella sp. D16C41]|uniref:alpha/beta fold hydrolase n=1 Tax=Legionella sp. D16C41 TaxID=3402688 RepID=UPI003AF85D56
MTELFYTNQSVSLNYFEGPKNGAPVLLLHGNMGRWQTFSLLIKELSKTKHIFAMDLRGHGKSSHVPDSYLLETHFQDVVSFLSGRINETVTLLGYSLGGMIALMVAAYYPELVRELIVLDSPLTLKTLTPIIESQKEFGQKILHYRQTNQIEQLYAAINDDASSIGMSLCDPSIIEITINQHEKMIEGFNIEQLTPLIKCPFLLLRGEAQLSSMISDEDVRRVKQLLPHLRERKILGLGHSMLAEESVISALLTEIAK